MLLLSYLVLVGEPGHQPYTAVVVQVARGTVQKGFDAKSITQSADDDGSSSDSGVAMDAAAGSADGGKVSKSKKKKKASDQPKVPRHLRVPRFIGIPMHVNFVSQVVVARLSEYKNGAHTRS